MTGHYRNCHQLPVQALHLVTLAHAIFFVSKMADGSKTKRFRNEPRSTLSCYALRLEPGQELKECLLKYVRDKKLAAPFVLSCVGSVTQATLRLANAARDTPNKVRNKTSLNAFTCHAWKTPRTSVVRLSANARDAGLLLTLYQRIEEACLFIFSRALDTWLARCLRGSRKFSLSWSVPYLNLLYKLTRLAHLFHSFPQLALISLYPHAQ